MAFNESNGDYDAKWPFNALFSQSSSQTASLAGLAAFNYPPNCLKMIILANRLISNDSLALLLVRKDPMGNEAGLVTDLERQLSPEPGDGVCSNHKLSIVRYK